MSEDRERVFVLRLSVGADQTVDISLYDADSGGRVYFTSLELLLMFLQRRLDEGSPTVTAHLRA